MNPTDFALFALQSAPATAGPGPTGAPTGLVSTDDGGPETSAIVRYTWTNTDATAYTRIYHEAGTCPGTPPLIHTANPGVTSYDTTDKVTDGPWRAQISHYKNGQESSKTSCVDST